MRKLPKLSAAHHGPQGAPWVTFVPGIGNDSAFWRDQADQFADRFQVLTFDPWGHGSSPPPPEPCGFADMIEGLVELLDTMEIKETALVGLGFGGSVALATALNHADRVTAVVACCCRARQPDDRRDFWRERRAKAATLGMDRIADMTVDRWLSEAFREQRPDADKALRDMMKRTTLQGYQALVDAFIEMDFTALLPRLTPPVMLVAAEKDHGGGPVEDMRAMAQAIAGARFEIIPGAGHIVNYEAPMALAELIGDFLIGGGE